MAGVHLTHEEFFSGLANLLAVHNGKDHGSIHMTQKRCPLPVLVRATNGSSKDKQTKKAKLSTIVQPNDIEAFFARYTEVAKAGMMGLKKRDRKARRAKKKKSDRGPADA